MPFPVRNSDRVTLTPPVLGARLAEFPLTALNSGCSLAVLRRVGQPRVFWALREIVAALGSPITRDPPLLLPAERPAHAADYGDAVPVEGDELPVFWACGVTPQAVIAQVRPEFCITHAPGSMLITDLVNSKLASL